MWEAAPSWWRKFAERQAVGLFCRMAGEEYGDWAEDTAWKLEKSRIVTIFECQ